MGINMIVHEKCFLHVPVIMLFEMHLKLSLSFFQPTLQLHVLGIIIFKHKDYYTGKDQVHAYTRDNYTESD